MGGRKGDGRREGRERGRVGDREIGRKWEAGMGREGGMEGGGREGIYRMMMSGT